MDVFYLYLSMLHAVMWNIFIGVRYNSQQDYFWHTIVCSVVLNILSRICHIWHIPVSARSDVHQCRTD